MTDRPWVLLPIETKVREFHAKILQSAVLAERGFDVVLGEQNAMIRQMPWLPRGVYIDKSVARTKTKPFRRLAEFGNKIAAWCEEGLVYRDRKTYLHERVSPDSLALADIFFAWGPMQADDVGGHVPAAKNKIRVSGNPRFDVLRPELRGLFDADAQALRQKYGHYILVATNFSRYNHFMGYDFWIEALKKRGTITTEEHLAFFQHWREYLGDLYRGFAAALPILDAAFPDHRIVVRPHPSEDHDAWRREVAGLANVTVAFEGSVIPWIAGSDALIHNSCTTGVEAYLLGKPVIAYQPATDDVLDSHLPNALSRQAFEPEELMAMVLQGLEAGMPVSDDAQADQYIAAQSGPLAAERVADGLAELNLPAASPAPALGARIRIAGDNAAAKMAPLVRRLRLGAKAQAYANQKFPGISLTEVQSALVQLSQVSGRFADVRAEPMAARNCFRITTVATS
jgi:surface carbohydrate biosynthesis protein